MPLACSTLAAIIDRAPVWHCRTTGFPVAVRLQPNRATLNADGEDVSVVTVQVADAQGRGVPDAHNLIWMYGSFDAFDVLYTGRGLSVGEIVDLFTTTLERALYA